MTIVKHSSSTKTKRGMSGTPCSVMRQRSHVTLPRTLPPSQCVCEPVRMQAGALWAVENNGLCKATLGKAQADTRDMHRHRVV